MEDNKENYIRNEDIEIAADVELILFTEGEKLDGKLEALAKKTMPPSRYKEASLIKELQRQGVGRPSTYSTIIETVLSPARGYATLEDKYITPTDRGKQLAKFLDRSFAGIINYNYTKNLEKALDKMADGKISEIAFLQEFYNSLEGAIKNNKELVINSDVSEKQICPKCGATMVIRRSRFGKLFYGCSNYPQCDGIKNMN